MLINRLYIIYDLLSRLPISSHLCLARQRNRMRPRLSIGPNHLKPNAAAAAATTRQPFHNHWDGAGSAVQFFFLQMVPAFPKNCFANGSRAFVLSFLERKAEPKTPRQLPGKSPTAPENSPTAPRKTPRQLPESTTTTPDNFPGTFPQTA